MKKERIIFIIGIITIIISSIISVYAASYLYNSNEVSYNNTSSGITSDNVQGAIDELYTEATNYTTLRNMIYPVGSIYISVEDDTVAKVEARYGGTWEVFGEGEALVGVKTSDTDFSTVEKHNGAKTINLSHSHTVNSHSHGLSTGRALIGRSTASISTISYKNAGGSSQKFDRRLGGTLGITGVSDVITDSTALEGNTGNSSPGTDSKLSATQSILQPYITVYMYKRTA